MRPVLRRPSNAKVFDHFAHNEVDVAHVAYFQNSIVLNVNVVWNEELMDKPSFVNVVEADSNLQKTVHESF